LNFDVPLVQISLPRMKLPSTLLHAILIAATVGATTACDSPGTVPETKTESPTQPVKARDTLATKAASPTVTPQDPDTVKGPTQVHDPRNCPACGKG